MRSWKAVPLLLLRAALLALLVTWVLSAESPSDGFRAAFAATLALFLGPLVVPAWRRAWLDRSHRWLRIPDLLGCNFFVFLLLGELSLTALSLVSESPLLVAPNANAEERIRRWRGIPGGTVNGFANNSLGYFDQEFPDHREKGIARIVALGDSFAVGVVPYPDNFLTRLEANLAPAVEVLNFGVVATGPEDYLYLYLTEAGAYEPDLVLLHFFVGNDFRSIRSASLLHLDSLRTTSVIRRLIRSYKPGQDANALPAEVPTFDVDEFLQLERARLEVCRIEPDRSTARAIQHTLAVLGDIAARIPRLGVVLIPDEYQVNEELFRALVPGRERERFDLGQPQRIVREFLHARGVPVLDLREALRTAEQQRPTYKQRDTHWNEEGNRVAADEITRWLREDPGLLDQGSPAWSARIEKLVPATQR